MTAPAPSSAANEMELAPLRALSRQFPSVDEALAEIAQLSAELTLPKGTVHVLSDVHGEDAKLRHVINNASGTLRPFVEGLGGSLALPPAELQDLLTLIFYPRETLERLEPTLLDPADRRTFCHRVLSQLLTLIRALAPRYPLPRLVRILPGVYRTLLHDLLCRPLEGDGLTIRPTEEGRADYVTASLEPLLRHDRALHLVRLTVRALRNLAVEELVIAGDCWDRGPRGDRVMEYLRQQPNVVFTWGNHDAAWLGACLGQEALIAQVLRISVRYRRLSQLEEGYGINLQPLEYLARTVYGDDPAECFVPRGAGLRATVQMARLQKAAAIMQFKLEGQTIERNLDWELEQRRLLHRIDLHAGTISIDGVARPLLDRRFPTLDPADPYALSAEERACMDRTKQSFRTSSTLWEHIRFLVGRGRMWLRRDDHLIFHGCVPVDDRGQFLSFTVDGRPCTGRALFDALERVVARTLDRPTAADLDMLWYLWCGPRSPLFGKDRITTLENDLVADPATHVETKNPYFALIHDPAFCERVLAEFGVNPQRGIIVNGHVPVKIDKGESPLKRSGKAITIDGAFSQAYGDHGYTLVLEPERTYLAKHHHFESVQAAVEKGVDIIPTLTEVRRWEPIRRVSDTEAGSEIRAQIELLERLIAAYRSNKLRQGAIP
jgi:fructose-1,6-bisphosphatase-3